MEQITINFDDKNYYIIIPRDNKYQLELSSNRVRIKIGDEDKSCKLVNSEKQ